MKFKKGHIPWLKGTKGVFKHSEETKKKISLHHAHYMKGKHHTLEARLKIKEARKKQIIPKGENNCGWKGENAGYMAKHNWIRTYYGRASKCENKNCDGISKTFDWANISHEYKRDISDYKQLCRKCHIAFDKKHHEED